MFREWIFAEVFQRAAHIGSRGRWFWLMLLWLAPGVYRARFGRGIAVGERFGAVFCVWVITGWWVDTKLGTWRGDGPHPLTLKALHGATAISENS